MGQRQRGATWRYIIVCSAAAEGGPILFSWTRDTNVACWSDDEDPSGRPGDPAGPLGHYIPADHPHNHGGVQKPEPEVRARRGGGREG